MSQQNTNPDAIAIEKLGYVLKVALNNPPYNPLGVAQIAALTQLIADIEDDKSIRVVVVCGAGNKNFSVGANLKEGHLAVEYGVKAFLQLRLDLFAAIEQLNKPVVAAIQGYCLGGGLELALACDFRLASPDALLGLPEIALGAAPMWGGAARLLRTVGKSQALSMLIQGEPINAQTALSIGLITQVINTDFAIGVAAYAQMLAAKPPLAVAAILKVLREGQHLPLDQALQLELDEFSQLANTKDNIEGVTAFLEKRKANFTGE